MKKLNHLLIGIVTCSLQLFITDLTAQVGFAPATNFAAGYHPQSIVSRDFNGDSKADLAVANHGDNNVSILLGDGVGGFAAATQFPSPNSPSTIISADFNNDGNFDLITCGDGSSTIYNVNLLLGDGLGGFIAGDTLPGVGAFSVRSADFNNDNNLDLVFSSHFFNADFLILIGDGAGHFSGPTYFSDPAFFSDNLTVADFNGDGNADIAVISTGTNNFGVILGDGLGGLGTANIYTIGMAPTEIYSADFNGDGNMDLATTDQNNNKVSVLLGNGTGTFAAAVNYTVGITPWGISSSDFNNDGKKDLVVTNRSGSGSNVSVLLGNGAGSFGTAINFSVGFDPAALTCADFNGDGKFDIASANYGDNNVSILLNNYIPQGPPICLVTVDSTLTHNLLVWEKTNLDLPAIDSFIVYREISTNNYQAIGAVYKDSLSVFNDLGANPATTGYRYKLKVKDTAGVESNFFSDYHNSIYLTNTGANFNWTPYQIENNLTPISNYNVYRDDNSTGVFNLIGNTTGNQFGYTDVQFSSFQNASYYVEAVLAGGSCNPTRSSIAASRSNLKHTGTTGIQQLNSISAIKIYPNPANNILSITGVSEKTILKMYDIGGKLVLEKEVESASTINIATLAEGVYTLLTESKTGRAFHKVVVNH